MLNCAFMSYEAGDPARAAKIQERLISYSMLEGELLTASCYKEVLAELYKEKLSNFEKAASIYQDLGEYYESFSEEATYGCFFAPKAIRALENAADLNVTLGNYITAIELYKKAAKSAAIEVWSSEFIADYIVKVVLLYIAVEDNAAATEYIGVAATEYIQDNDNPHSSFQIERGYEFAKDVLDSYNKGVDAEELSNLLDSYTPYYNASDDSKKILLEIKSSIL